MSAKEFDVIIVGAGPSGCSAALSLRNSGLKIAIFDKATFPRNKICGGALSLDVVNQLNKISPELYQNFSQFANKQPIDKIKITVPNDDSLVFSIEKSQKKGFVCNRLDFDNFLVNETKKCNNICFFENTKIVEYERKKDFYQIKSDDNEIYNAKILLVANGAYSNFNRKLSQSKVDKNNYSVAIQAFYENIKVENQNTLELYYLKETLPGYFWIFPTLDQKVNVGLGLLAKDITKNKINLKKLFGDILNKPEFKDRFSDAQKIGNLKSYGLPLGGSKKSLSGNRYLLLGDAASLIDPFLGEGIGNAIRSGRFAAEQVKKCFVDNYFSAKFNKNYDKIVYKSVHKEQKRYLFLQKMFRFPKIANISLKICKKTKLLNFFFGNVIELIK